MKRFDSKKLTTLAMLCALAYVVMAVGRIPILLFLSYDPEGCGHRHRRLFVWPHVRFSHLRCGIGGGDGHRQRYRSMGAADECAFHLRFCLHRLFCLQEETHRKRRGVRAAFWA